MNLKFAYQNMTEGWPTDALRNADVVIGSEISRMAIINGLPDKRHYFPEEDPHQSISWDPKKLKVTKTGYVRYHRSGKAEHFPYPTPARGFLYVVGEVIATGELVVIVGTWILNSWNPIHPDKDTAHRRGVARRSLDKLNDRLLGWIGDDLPDDVKPKRGRTVILAGDFNSLRWHGKLRGMVQLHSRGLDRVYVSKRAIKGEVFREISRVTEGPKTGKGNDKQHHSLLWSLDFGRRKQ